MFIHMFAFRWKPGVTDAQITQVATEIAALQGQIPELLESSVGRNLSPRGGEYGFGGVMKFADQAAMERYNSHPAHQKLLQWLLPLIDPIEVDFEV
jgi:hypothetical protein